MSSANKTLPLTGKVCDIVQLGNPLLRQTAQKVTDTAAPQVEQTIVDMLATLAVSNGVGIAAPQIGISLAIIIIASRPTPRYPNAPDMPPVVMINPGYEIIEHTRKKDWEGCLSIPGIRALVPRYQAIKVSFQSPQMTANTLELSDFPARVFQHEFDHLSGNVYLDRVENNVDIITESEFMARYLD